MSKKQETSSRFTRQVNNQISETYKRAFFDLLCQHVEAVPPDYDWLSRLYEEIKTKLITLLKENSSLRSEIEDNMDSALFMQMISNDAFSPQDLINLIQYVFAKCKQLGSPARDSNIEVKLKEINDLIESGDATFATIIPLFIKNANECIDLIYEDIKNLDINSKIS